MCLSKLKPTVPHETTTKVLLEDSKIKRSSVKSGISFICLRTWQCEVNIMESTRLWEKIQKEKKKTIQEEKKNLNIVFLILSKKKSMTNV